ncbi:MAG: hypothetical protein JW708_09650 [Vallitaleaceae bacterium]|nr:hypothetical protein [Vallitaleaceae bacterium]
MMNRYYCLNEEEFMEAQACLLLAYQQGLIDQPGIEGVEIRRLAKKIEPYGLSSFSPPAYLQYELTRFRLDFVSENEVIQQNHNYSKISEERKRGYYKEHPQLFTRYHGDFFSYKEVAMIIEKRIREEEYNELIQNLLCQFDTRS